MQHKVSLSLREVKAAPNGPVLGLHIVASPSTFVANVGDTVEFQINPGLPYAKGFQGKSPTSLPTYSVWTIEFMKPKLEDNDSNKPYGWPFRGKSYKMVATFLTGPTILLDTPPVISRDQKPAKGGKNLARRYTYSVTAEIPWGDENPSFPKSLLKDSDRTSGAYKVTDDPELYVDECCRRTLQPSSTGSKQHTSKWLRLAVDFSVDLTPYQIAQPRSEIPGGFSDGGSRWEPQRLSETQTKGETNVNRHSDGP